jgi:hypothetical protein
MPRLTNLEIGRDSWRVPNECLRAKLENMPRRTVSGDDQDGRAGVPTGSARKSRTGKERIKRLSLYPGIEDVRPERDANFAWKATLHLVRAAGLSVDVTFRWANNEEAANPGQIGCMSYKP